MNKKIEDFTEIELVEAISSKNSEVIELIVREYTSYLLKGAYGLGFISDQEAEDLVQNTWAIFFQAPDKFEGRSQLKTYLFGILYNKARELHRDIQKNIPEDRIEDLLNDCFDDKGHWSSHLVSPDKMLEASQTLSFIEKCLTNLPLSQRLAFYLREIEEYSSQEICKILDVTVTNLGVLLFRAKASLRHCLEFKITR